MSLDRCIPLVSVVDDDPSMREAMRGVLQADGLRAITFDSAASFLNGACLGDLACIILDLRMPGMSGLDLLRRLGAAPRLPPVILMSAHLDTAVEQDALHAGAVACLRKPFDAEALLEVVHGVLQR